jgi:hypothetical protein
MTTDHTTVHDIGERAQGGPVIVDIGAGVGALVVRLHPGRIATELHLRPLDGGPQTHTGVWERHTPNGRVVAAVFPSLPEGHYCVLGTDGTPTTTVHIHGGQVTELILDHDPHGPMTADPLH